MLNNKYFKRKEFECKCGCGFAAVDTELLKVLTDVRETFGVPLVITSGNRCAKHNANIGGAPNSSHVLGLAVDFRPYHHVEGFAEYISNIRKYLRDKYPDKYGVASKESSFVHLDVKPGKARNWNY